MSVETGQPEDTVDGEYVICPYCGAKYGDCWEWVKQEPRTKDCDECGKEFEYWAVVSVDYHAQALPVAAPEEERETR
jgi:DNA-directed RNA polymerase subunit RPC12/RpoP